MHAYSRTIVSVVRRGLRPLAGAAVLLVLAAAAAVALMPAAPDRAADAKSWGGEALVVSSDAWSPIAAANACGMGASSCFKCHNGARAAAPKMEKATAPWHVDHKTVNQSCAGCHKGNARIIKKELAHEGLVKDPRASSAETCGTCHKSGNVAELAKTYQR